MPYLGVFIVFAQSPHRTSSFLSTWLGILLNYMVTIKAFGADTSSYALSDYHLAYGPHDKLANLETNNSRIECTVVKDIIRNWVVRKTTKS